MYTKSPKACKTQGPQPQLSTNKIAQSYFKFVAALDGLWPKTAGSGCLLKQATSGETPWTSAPVTGSVRNRVEVTCRRTVLLWPSASWTAFGRCCCSIFWVKRRSFSARLKFDGSSSSSSSAIFARSCYTACHIQHEKTCTLLHNWKSILASDRMTCSRAKFWVWRKVWLQCVHLERLINFEI